MTKNKHYIVNHAAITQSKKIFRVLCALIMLIVATSCSRFLTRTSLEKKTIRIPQNHTLAWYPRYIIVNNDYSKLFENKNIRAKIRDVTRRGDILRIIDIDGEVGDGFIWYKVQLATQTTDDGITEGWILLRNVIRTHALTKAQHISRKIVRRKKALNAK